MLAGLEHRDGLFRMKIRRAFDGHRIQLEADAALVAVEAGEPRGGVHLEFVAELLHAIGEIVVEGDDLGVRVLLEQAGRRNGRVRRTR